MSFGNGENFMSQTMYGFIGLGLIGDSLAKALKKIDSGCKIAAYTRTKATTQKALAAGDIDTVCASTHDPLCPCGTQYCSIGRLKTSFESQLYSYRCGQC